MLERSLEFFRPHHLELRKRIVKVFLSVIITTCVAYIFSEQITGFFIAPLLQASPYIKKLVYTNLPEAFISYIKLSLLIGVIASFPVILYQLWVFVSPGLRKDEKKLAIIVVFWASILFLGGASFAFFLVMPRMLAFFMSYASPSLEPLPKFGMYLTFVARTMLAFGLSFEIPFLMVMAGKAGLVQVVYFRKKRWYFYGVIVVLAFMLTTGDFLATGLLSLPLFALYETGIFLSSFLGKRKEEEQKDDSSE
jgi:sec-independent protein translocase protein TatC